MELRSEIGKDGVGFTSVCPGNIGAGTVDLETAAFPEIPS